MKAAKYIWMNGKMVPWAEATVHVMAHGLHYGTSVFEGIRCYATNRGPAIFRLGPHIRRLLDSASVYRMPIAWDAEEIAETCREIIRVNDLQSAYIRPIIWRGEGTIAVDPQDQCPIEMAVAAFELGAYLGREGIENGIDACVSSWHRTTSSSNPVLSKAGGHYTNAYLIGAEARRNGYGEGISVSDKGLVCEGAAANLFMIRDGVVNTPPLSNSILGGITRDSAVTLSRDLGLEVIERDFPREMLYTADELFLTGTAAEITPVRSVDRIPVGTGKPGPITKSIQSAFFGLFTGETPDRHQWLDPVETSGGQAKRKNSASEKPATTA